MKREPVIMLGCQKDWAAKNWTFRNILDRFPNDLQWAAILKNDSMPTDKAEMRGKDEIFKLLDNPQNTLKIFEMLPVLHFQQEKRGKFDGMDLKLEPSDEKNKVVCSQIRVAKLCHLTFSRTFQAVLMYDYSKPDPLPEDLFTEYGYVYQAYIILATRDTGTKNLETTTSYERVMTK